MGHNLKIRPKTVESSPSGLCSGTITSLWTTGVCRICSHQ